MHLKTTLITFLITIVVLVQNSSSYGEIREDFVEIQIDHFDIFNTKTFKAKYFVNDQFWSPGATIFIYVTSGGHDSNKEFLESGLIYDLAKENNGILFSMQQRFFGESQPVEKMSLKDLRLLTIDQTVADIAMFINYIRQKYEGAMNSRIVLFGKGYGASLAVWTRQKYPHLVDAVLASSAYTNIQFEYPKMLKNVFKVFNKIGGDECCKVISGAMKAIEDSIVKKDTSEVEKRLRLCKPIDLTKDQSIAMVFAMISNELSNFITDVTQNKIEAACNKMQEIENSENNLVAFTSWHSNELFLNQTCLQYDYDELIKALKSGLEEPFYKTSLQTNWVFCTQFGHFGTTSDNQPFGERLTKDFFMKFCSDLFGEEIFNEKVLSEIIFHDNIFYGSSNPRTDHVFFTYGELDPRIDLGISESINSPIVVMTSKFELSVMSTNILILIEFHRSTKRQGFRKFI
jgi:hypothetical protein